jgi:hypothetical protein
MNTGANDFTNPTESFPAALLQVLANGIQVMTVARGVNVIEYSFAFAGIRAAFLSHVLQSIPMSREPDARNVRKPLGNGTIIACLIITEELYES